MRRVLKAWVAHNPTMAYWQGKSRTSRFAPISPTHRIQLAIL